MKTNIKLIYPVVGIGSPVLSGRLESLAVLPITSMVPAIFLVVTGFLFSRTGTDLTESPKNNNFIQQIFMEHGYIYVHKNHT